MGKVFGKAMASLSENLNLKRIGSVFLVLFFVGYLKRV